LGINSSGQVVGQADTSAGLFDAFLYSGGTMTDLNDLVDLSATGFGKLYAAQAINDNGQILAGACATPSNCTGLGHSVLLTPAVPEPATLTLLAAALLVFPGLRFTSRWGGSPSRTVPTRAARY
jgi:probable HAF family extracellular repeat protein